MQIKANIKYVLILFFEMNIINCIHQIPQWYIFNLRVSKPKALSCLCLKFKYNKLKYMFTLMKLIIQDDTTYVYSVLPLNITLDN